MFLTHSGKIIESKRHAGTALVKVLSLNIVNIHCMLQKQIAVTVGTTGLIFISKDDKFKAPIRLSAAK